jgi:hypothetical protein
MKMRHVIACVGVAGMLTAPLGAQQTEEERQRAANMARELERVANQLRAVRADAQGQGGGRGARSGGAPQGGSLFRAPGSFDPSSNDPSIRREQTIVGMDWANPQNAQQQSITVITFDSEPGDPRPYQLDQAAKTARRVSRTAAASPGGVNAGLTISMNTTLSAGVGGAPVVASIANIDMPVNFQGLTIPRRGIPADLRPTDENLGTRQMDGIKATGTRTTVTIPTDRVGNDRPIQITDERWESPELGVVVYSRFSDPRTGIVEYRLTNVNRSEPAATLFQIPSDYTEITGGRGAGGGGARGRGRGGAPQQ